ncbi:MAG: aminopeptidase P family protein [Acidobacteriota bacterium]|nr:aminopeptidase P family protein [Acidobacteriota bacterium]
MFSADIYIQRRNRLKTQLKSGLAFFPGNKESPMNYAANQYHFRQDSSFLYFFGLDSPGLVGVIDLDDGTEAIFGNEIDIEDIIWMGALPSVKERAEAVGVKKTFPLNALRDELKKALDRRRAVHYLPPYRTEASRMIEKLLGISPESVRAGSSADLIQAVVAQRSFKSGEEVAEIEKALDITYDMYAAAMSMAHPGRYEREIVGAMEGLARARGGLVAFPPIVSINSQILHNNDYGNRLKKGRLLVMDAGAESARHYGSDITRTIPVGGEFTARQKDVYDIVLDAQMRAIQAVRPGAAFKDLHLQTSRTIAAGLKDIGLMKGDTGEAVGQGAHALFFPHGLGHMLGLDVHDMESLGEDNVGYDPSVPRSEQFGLAYLRMAKELRPGHVMTIEPGIYFIPALIDKMRNEKKFLDFVRYDKLEKYGNFGGVRIEDNILVTDKGHRLLGKSIPKTPADIRKAVG